MSDELLEKLKTAVIEGKEQDAVILCREALEKGLKNHP